MVKRYLKKTVGTSERIQGISTIMTSRLVLFREITGVYCQNLTKHLNVYTMQRS